MPRACDHPRSVSCLIPCQIPGVERFGRQWQDPEHTLANWRTVRLVRWDRGASSSLADHLCLLVIGIHGGLSRVVWTSLVISPKVTERQSNRSLPPGDN